jgi:hypothetical protein
VTAPRTTVLALLAVVVLTAVGAVVYLRATRETREAWRWPFEADSPWNRGVGADAEFEDEDDPRTADLIDDDVPAYVNAGTFSHPIYRATDDDPMATVEVRDGTTVEYRIPDDARPAEGTDAHLHVVDPDDDVLHESFKMEGENPRWTSGYYVRTDLRGPGVGEQGVRAYGGSAIGGLIRAWELREGEITHALAVALDGDALKEGFVWPATAEDANAPDEYEGEVPMGTFAAIPPDVDVEAIEGLTRPGRILARALQRYGAYVTDQTHDTFALYAEPTVPDAAIARLKADLPTLRALLRVVTNNGPDRVNGGGDRTVPKPPPFG